jgi:hypothetical protein
VWCILRVTRSSPPQWTSSLRSAPCPGSVASAAALAWCTIYDAAPIVHDEVQCGVFTDSHTTARAMGAALTRLGGDCV